MCLLSSYKKHTSGVDPDLHGGSYVDVQKRGGQTACPPLQLM